jgi:hypothetical protein
MQVSTKIYAMHDELFIYSLIQHLFQFVHDNTIQYRCASGFAFSIGPAPKLKANFSRKTPIQAIRGFSLIQPAAIGGHHFAH